MSELAHNQVGEPFEVPATATGWRVKRLKAKGAPEVVYSHEGPPLVLAIDDGIDELRAAVDGVPGRYRLDPIGDDGKQLAGPSGYVYVHPAPAAAPPAPELAALRTLAALPAPPALPPASDSVAIEMLRMHTEGMREALRATAQIATHVVGGVPSMMGATANVLQAADGAGLPARPPRAIDAVAIEADADAEDETEDAADADGPTESSSPLVEFGNAIAAQMLPMMPVLVPALVSKLGGMLGVGMAAPATPPKQPKTTAPAPNPATIAPRATLTSIDPAVIAKLGPIYMQLSPAEQMRTTKLALELAPEEQAAFAAQLAELAPDTALAKVRALIGTDTSGAAS